MGDEKKTPQTSRRGFFGTSALLGGSATMASMLGSACESLAQAQERGESPFDDPANTLHTTCLGCHAHCNIKAKVHRGVLMKLEGSPYGPNGRLPHLPYSTPPAVEAIEDGKMCLKGQSGIQVQYDPYRITKVLKRAGRRGENKWRTVPFDQAIREICEGGTLFRDVPGEENRQVEGLRSIHALRDAHVAEEMARDVQGILHAPQGEAKRAAVEGFKRKFSSFQGRNWLDTLIDPNHPDLGPRNNQFVWYGGRVQYGREAFSLRWMEGGFGSCNWVNHCTICGGSHRCGHAMLAAQYDPTDGGMRNEPGKVDICYFSADFLHTEFVVLFGHLVFEANYGPTHLTQRLIEGMVAGRTTVVEVDPRLSKTASKADRWIPIRPATDGALMWAMMRWIIDNERFDARFLANANKAAALADNETCWANGVYLVKIEDDGPGDLLRAGDLALEEPQRVVVMREGAPVAVNPNDDTNAVEGQTFYDGEVASADGARRFQVKSGWQLIREYAFSKSLEEWSEICGVDTDTIVWLAREFTSHGKRAVADAHRGLATNSWGTMNVLAMNTLNTLIGNMDWAGGLQKGGGSWDFKGTKPHQPYSIVKGLHPGHTTIFGTPLSKQHSMRGLGHMDTTYENSTLFSGYPARRPWYGPARWGIFQEALIAGATGYPYPMKALWIGCWATPAASVGGAQPQIDVLSNPAKLPLFFATDIVIGETSMYADYIFPDTSYLEELQLSKWPSANVPHKANPLRQPVVAPVVDTCTVHGQEMPINMESVMLAIADKLGLPGYGPNGFAEGQDLTHYDQFYLKSAADVGVGDKPHDEVPEASDEEIEIFKRAHAHLPRSVYDYARWKSAAGEEHWRRVVTIFNRGGRFDDFEHGYDGDKMGPGTRMARMLTVYIETTARMRHPGTGRRLPGFAEWRPVEDFLGRDVFAMDERAGYPYTFITYKVVGGANYRGVAPYYWIQETLPENFVVMHVDDARREGFEDGDLVKLTSASNPEGVWNLRNGRRYPVGGKLKTTEGIRPGVVAVSYHYGHWAYGSTEVTIDDVVVPGDPRRGTGINPNAIVRLDPHLKDVTPSDPIGGQQSLPTKVKVLRMSAAEIELMRRHNPAALSAPGLSKTFLGGV
jgi:anaerobic selenocysteine-containing dehydrogenase